MLQSNNRVRKLFFEYAVKNNLKSYIGDDFKNETKPTFHYHVLDESGRINTYMSASIEGNECYCIELISSNFKRKDYIEFVKFIEMLTNCVSLIDIYVDLDSPAVHISKKLFKKFGGWHKVEKEKINFVWVKAGMGCL